MSNNERFNAMINSTSDPRRMMEALKTLAPIIRATKKSEQEAICDTSS